MNNTAIYIRVSTDKQVEHGYSIEAQKRNLIKIAKEKNLNIYKIYKDAGISGKNITDRPGIKKLIQDIKSNKINIILIQKIDRLTRNVIDTEDFIELFRQYNVEVWSISDGKIDLTSSNGRMITLLKGVFAQHEREQTIERIKFALNQKAKEGYPLCCACAPYGYRKVKGKKDLIIDKKESEITKTIFNMFISNNTYTEIANYLNKEKIPTKKTTKEKKILWTPKTIKLILSNPVYIGKIRYGINKKTFKISNGNHTKIIDLKKWNIVQEKIKKTENIIKTNSYKNDAYFIDLIICNKCNCKMTVHRTKKNNRTYISYKCINKKCNSSSISHKKIEKEFINYIQGKETKISLVERKGKLKDNKIITKNELDKLTKKINDKEKKIINLYINDIINKKRLNELLNDINNEKNELILNYNNGLVTLSSDNELAEWLTMTNKEKRFYILDNYISIKYK